MKMLVVVDYQKDFVDGALGFTGAEKLDLPISEKIKEYIRRDNAVIFTYDSHGENYMNTREGKHLPIPHCIEGTVGWELYGKTGNVLHELDQNDEIGNSLIYNIMKVTFGMAPEAVVSIKQKAMEYYGEFPETIEFIGLVSNICVISNICVFQAAFPEAQIVVDPTLIASHDPEMHEAVLKVMQSLQVEFI